jgi:hypothetical protein
VCGGPPHAARPPPGQEGPPGRGLPVGARARSGAAPLGTGGQGAGRERRSVRAWPWRLGHMPHLTRLAPPRRARRPPWLRAHAAGAARPGTGARGRRVPWHQWGAPRVLPGDVGPWLMGRWPQPYRHTPGTTSPRLPGPAWQETGGSTPDTCAGAGRRGPRRPTRRSGLDAPRGRGLSRPHRH